MCVCVCVLLMRVCVCVNACVCALVCVCVQVVSQRISSVDLSCCSLEKLPPNLLYSQDLTHLNLKHNFLPLDQTLLQLQRCVTPNQFKLQRKLIMTNRVQYSKVEFTQSREINICIMCVYITTHLQYIY